MNLVCRVLVVALLAVVGLSESTPLKSASNGTRYLLYTQKNPSAGQELVCGDLNSVKASNFNPDVPTKIIIHGWTQSAEKIPNPQLRSAYLSVGKFNLISVDWGHHASMNYFASRSKVAEVGADIAKFVDFLNAYAGQSFKSLVVIGHSLGAHVAGFTGKYVTRGRLPYIVGLDPALPLFNYKKPNERLNSNDADYVETIQTNGGLKGFLEPIGSASFYPNWGRSQPGCGFDFNGGCAHARAVLYYAEAIMGYDFTPVRVCSSYTNITDQKGCDATACDLNIGDPMKISHQKGIFHFTTSSAEPFGHLS